MNPETPSPVETRTRRPWVIGAVLIAVGLVSLAAQFIDLEGLSIGLLVVPTLGLIFLLAGILTHEGGWLIPGGILTGIGAGIYLIGGPYENMEGTLPPGIFLLTFAAGWGLITLLSAIFTRETLWWPLIPGGILAAIGAALAAGGAALQALEFVGRFWPLALIGFGIYLLLKRR